MSDSTPIDWDEFWREAEGDRRRSANVGQYGKADLLDRFFERVGVPADAAFVGCGPAAIAFELADRYPGTEFHGFDVAESVVADDRERAAERGLDNLGFAVAALPELAVDDEFELVYCYATLHYVRDVRAALRSLYGLVRAGGHLVVNYPNGLTRAAYRREHGDEDAFRERFALVFEGANLLSYRRIHDVLDSWPRSYWSAVDAPDEPWTDRTNPCVYVPK